MHESVDFYLISGFICIAIQFQARPDALLQVKVLRMLTECSIFFNLINYCKPKDNYRIHFNFCETCYF